MDREDAVTSSHRPADPAKDFRRQAAPDLCRIGMGLFQDWNVFQDGSTAFS